MTHPRVVLWTPLTRQLVPLAAKLRETGMELIVPGSEAECVAALAEADAAFLAGPHGGYTARIAQAVHAAPRLRWIQLIATGQEGIDERGVPAQVKVTGVGDASAPIVAEHAVALLLGLARRLGDAALQMPDGKWNPAAIAPRMASLEGRTLCLAGFGRIGKEIARRVQGFGTQCIAVNRSGRNELPQLVREVFTMERLHEALAQSDAVAISLPLAAATRGLFDAAAWSACRKGALVVNVGRGAVIDQASLVAALEQGQLAGAGLDVTDPEPLPADHPLWRAPNLLLTPHVGGAGSREGLVRLVALIAENLRRFRAGEPLLHEVAVGA